MQHSNAILSALKQNIAKVVVGKEDVVELLLTALLCEGHILIDIQLGQLRCREVLLHALCRYVTVAHSVGVVEEICHIYRVGHYRGIGTRIA